MTALPESVLARHREVLESFVVRARRVASHSLTEDVQQFLEWAKVNATVSMSDTGGTIDWRLPPEEAFESLASRCRPFMLEGERVHLPTVLKSVSAFTREREDLRAAVEIVRRTWRGALKPELPVLTGTGALGEVPDELVSHVVLAEQWLYGDLVHNDQARSRVLRDTTIDQRYISAVAVYRQVAVCAVALLRLLERMQTDGLLQLDPTVFNLAVSVSVPLTFPLSMVRLSEAITDPEELPPHESRRAR